MDHFEYSDHTIISLGLFSLEFESKLKRKDVTITSGKNYGNSTLRSCSAWGFFVFVFSSK